MSGAHAVCNDRIYDRKEDDPYWERFRDYTPGACACTDCALFMQQYPDFRDNAAPTKRVPANGDLKL